MFILDFGEKTKITEINGENPRIIGERKTWAESVRVRSLVVGGVSVFVDDKNITTSAKQAKNVGSQL